MKKIEYFQNAEKTISDIKSNGAFLVVKSEIDDRINTMTIGWVSLGFMWSKPIMTVMVRKSRFTFQLIEKATSFTVSIPKDKLGKALSFWGTKSGRDFDKFKECNLVTIPAQSVTTPIIHIPGAHYECKIVCKSEMNPDLLCKEYKKINYANNDFHTFYFGEITEYYNINQLLN